MINLNDFRRKEFSQNAEDGIVEKIFELIGTTNKYAVEIGVGNGDECCSRFIRERMGFDGIMFDMGFEHEARKLFKEFITVDNIIPLLQRHSVPAQFDFLGLDIDSFDFYVMFKILQHYQPRLIVVETNPTFTTRDMVVKLNHDCQGFWAYHGASLAAWLNLLNSFGYHLVCHEYNGINAFFTQDKVDVEGFDSMALFQEHEGKPGCSLANYKVYPDDFPVLNSNEAIRLIKNYNKTPEEIKKEEEIQPVTLSDNEIRFKQLYESGAPMYAFKKFGMKNSQDVKNRYQSIGDRNARF